jgi:macrodomain Ter protein organizer (MatP/YcbG family)
MQRTKARKRLKSPKKTTRVTVDMPFEKHKRLKAVAALKGETLQEFILTCVDEKIHEPSAKSKLDQLEELGLFAATEKTEITSTNYRDFIKKSLKTKHEK